MSNVKILQAELRTGGPFAIRLEEGMLLQVSVNDTFSEQRVLNLEPAYMHMGLGCHDNELRAREQAIRDMARSIARRIEQDIITALQQKARESRPVHISDAFNGK